VQRGGRRSPPSIVLGAALTALVLAGCGGSTSSQASYATLVGEGLKLLQQANTGAATQKFQEAIKRNEANPVAYYDLGVVYQRRGNTSQAEHQYLLAIHYGPAYVPALYNLAGLLVNKFPALAVFYYRRIIRVQPHSPTAYLNLGLLEAANPGEHKLGLADLAEAIKLDPTLRADVPPLLLAELPAARRR
jgi:tetratricopeptide (TPR) repeat protein